MTASFHSKNTDRVRAGRGVHVVLCLMLGASLSAQTQLAWILATSPDASIRNPAVAVTVAEQLVATTSGKDAGALDVLAAALAATGQFDRAVETAERMLAVLGPEADPRTVAAARGRLALYQQRTAYQSGLSTGRVDHP